MSNGKLRAFIIDPEKQEVSFARVDRIDADGYETVRAAISCQAFAASPLQMLSTGEWLYYDDEPSSCAPAAHVAGLGPVRGKSLVVCHDEGGYLSSPICGLDDVRGLVTFPANAF